MGEKLAKIKSTLRIFKNAKFFIFLLCANGLWRWRGDFWVCAVGVAKNWRKNWQFIRDKSAKIGFFILVKGAKIGGILEGF